MNIGVDSSLIVAGVHANHPRHALAASWLIRNIGKHHRCASFDSGDLCRSDPAAR
jgi:hypothetical protein